MRKRRVNKHVFSSEGRYKTTTVFLQEETHYSHKIVDSIL